jgi:LysM repeat protein
MSLYIHSANYQKKHRASAIFVRRNNLFSIRRVRIDINNIQMKAKNILLIILLFSCSFISKAETQDSVGLKVKKGMIYIMHKVEKGQGLYAIGRRYGMSYKKISAINPGSETRLYIGQIILVPTGKKAPLEEKVVEEYFEENKEPIKVKTDPRIKTKKVVRSTFAKFHTVKSGETLYRIAQQYKTTTKVLIDLNEMEKTSLFVGQKLLVPLGDENEKADGSVDKKPDTPKKEAAETKVGVEKKNDKAEKTISAPGAYSKKIDPMPEFDVEKISEIGNLLFSEDDDLSSNKKVASHHEAKIGTTIMVTNPVNNKAIFVKVVKNHTMDTEKANMIIIPVAVATKIGLENGQSVTTSYAQ